MSTHARRPRANVSLSVPTSESPRGAIEIAPVLEALGDRASDEPAVLVRLLLFAEDEVTGEQRLVGSFLKKVSMPTDLASPRAKIALEIFGERRIFKPTDIIWDEPHRVCIIEVAWMVADAATIVDRVKPHASGQSADRRQSTKPGPQSAVSRALGQ